MYAIIKTGGKQVKAEVRQAIYAEKLDVEAGEKVVFDEAILVGGEFTEVGAPVVAGAIVEDIAEKHDKQKKATTFKYKPKKYSHRRQGHHQPCTKVAIDVINV